MGGDPAVHQLPCMTIEPNAVGGTGRLTASGRAAGGRLAGEWASVCGVELKGQSVSQLVRGLVGQRVGRCIGA
jgi:hypothetical protein